MTRLTDRVPRSRRGPAPAADRILELTSAAFVAIDRRGRIAGWNLAAEQMFGRGRHEAFGRDFRDTILGSACSRKGDSLKRYLRTGDAAGVDRRIELVACRRDGREFPVALTLAPINSPGPIAFSAFFDDITDRDEALGRAERAQFEVVERLARAAEYRDGATGHHCERVGELASALARELQLPDRDVALIRRAAPVHDVGKIGIADAVLLKPGSLTDDELEHMKSHTVAGARLLAGGESQLLEMAHDIALFHHERWDGAGYPNALAGAEIPLPARIVAVADAFDAITHERPYKPARTALEALEIMRSERGHHFDPAVVDGFVLMCTRPLAESDKRATPRFGRPGAERADAVTLRCLVCGAHTAVAPLHHPGGQCGNCRSYRLVPLEQAAGVPQASNRC